MTASRQAMAIEMASESLRFVTLDVFTATRFAGNPLALVLLSPKDHSISQAAKQKIARELNLSETAFLHLPAPDEAGKDGLQLRLDIFTPDQELPFAGHPTIGAASFVLRPDLAPAGPSLGRVAALLTKAGPIPVSGPAASLVRARIPHDAHVHAATMRSALGLADAVDHADAAAAAGLSADRTLRAAELDAPVVSIVRGMTFALARLPDLAALGRAAAGPPLDCGGARLMDEGWDVGWPKRYYFVHLGTGSVDCNGGDGGGGQRLARKVTLRTRMLKEFEDPATGSAASALACYLVLSESELLGEGGAAEAETGFFFEIQQGVEMGRPSVIYVEVSRERDAASGKWRIKDVHLSGSSALVMEGTVHL